MERQRWETEGRKRGGRYSHVINDKWWQSVGGGGGAGRLHGSLPAERLLLGGGWRKRRKTHPGPCQTSSSSLQEQETSLLNGRKRSRQIDFLSSANLVCLIKPLDAQHNLFIFFKFPYLGFIFMRWLAVFFFPTGWGGREGWRECGHVGGGSPVDSTTSMFSLLWLDGFTLGNFKCFSPC